jgi:hypothetical protein
MADRGITPFHGMLGALTMHPVRKFELGALTPMERMDS